MQSIDGMEPCKIPRGILLHAYPDDGFVTVTKHQGLEIGPLEQSEKLYSCRTGLCYVGKFCQPGLETRITGAPQEEYEITVTSVPISDDRLFLLTDITGMLNGSGDVREYSECIDLSETAFTYHFSSGSVVSFSACLSRTLRKLGPPLTREDIIAIQTELFKEFGYPLDCILCVED